METLLRGKSDPFDAIEAARAALSVEQPASPNRETVPSRPSGFWSSPNGRPARLTRRWPQHAHPARHREQSMRSSGDLLEQVAEITRRLRPRGEYTPGITLAPVPSPEVEAYRDSFVNWVRFNHRDIPSVFIYLALCAVVALGSPGSATNSPITSWPRPRSCPAGPSAAITSPRGRCRRTTAMGLRSRRTRHPASYRDGEVGDGDGRS